VVVSLGKEKDPLTALSCLMGCMAACNHYDVLRRKEPLSPGCLHAPVHEHTFCAAAGISRSSCSSKNS